MNLYRTLVKANAMANPTTPTTMNQRPARVPLVARTHPTPSSSTEEKKRKWGVFEELAEKKRRIEDECQAATDRIRDIMGEETPVSDIQVGGRAINAAIDEATDRCIGELETFLVNDLGWTGMSLRHVCPVCRSRIIGKPAALFCGHVFCKGCVKSLIVPHSDDEDDRSRSSWTTTDSSDIVDTVSCGVVATFCDA